MSIYLHLSPRRHQHWTPKVSYTSLRHELFYAPPSPPECTQSIGNPRRNSRCASQIAVLEPWLELSGPIMPHARLFNRSVPVNSMKLYTSSLTSDTDEIADEEDSTTSEGGPNSIAPPHVRRKAMVKNGLMSPKDIDAGGNEGSDSCRTIGEDIDAMVISFRNTPDTPAAKCRVRHADCALRNVSAADTVSLMPCTFTCRSPSATYKHNRMNTLSNAIVNVPHADVNLNAHWRASTGAMSSSESNDLHQLAQSSTRDAADRSLFRVDDGSYVLPPPVIHNAYALPSINCSQMGHCPPPESLVNDHRHIPRLRIGHETPDGDTSGVEQRNNPPCSLAFASGARKFVEHGAKTVNIVHHLPWTPSHRRDP
ncbi:hypothetical protein C8Q76DRAFT_694692 [Earliella scabrosa]|nr:hypothetical protein C8Q76DRAFT_694692 [Earliella scabrosa]